MIMRLYRCTKFTKDCYPCDHRYRHSYNSGTCSTTCQHDKEAKCELCEGDMYINEKRDMALAEAREEKYLDRMGKSIEDITQILREQDTSTWEGFGALLHWAREQDWWNDFLEENGMVIQKVVDGDTEPAIFEYFPVTLMDPDEFADAISAYLDELNEQKEKDPTDDNDESGGESTEVTEPPESNIFLGSCSGKVWSNCIKEKCDHYLDHDITNCKSFYCHNIKRSVWCVTVKKTITESQRIGGHAKDVWSTSNL